MVTSRATYRILYADTDQMGVVYYGNYPRFYEIGRVEMVREIGYPYKALEDSGLFMPIASINSKYLRPLYYDELITIETTVKEMPKARMVFYHTIYNSKMEKVHTAEVTLVFLGKDTNRPTRMPDILKEKLEAVWVQQNEQKGKD